MNQQFNIPKVFFGFLLASFLMWALINLSKEYTTIKNYKIEIESLAQDKVLQENPIDNIDIKLKATGFKLFLSHFSEKKISFSANKLIKKNKSYYFFLARNQKEKTQSQLSSGLKLVSFMEDSIFLKLGNLKSKKVKVKPNIALEYKVGYNISEPIIVKPDSVIVSGPELQLEKLTFIETEPKEFKEISENFSNQLKLTTPNNLSKIKINKEIVEIEVLIDKFTEGEFEIPVQVINIPKDTELNIYPKNIKITFKVGLNNFDKVTPELFQVVCDYNDTKNKKLQYLIPKLTLKPELVSSVRIVPEKIDFLIHQ